MGELWLVDAEAAAPALEALERERPRLTAQDREHARRLREPGERRLRLAIYAALRIVLERVGGPRVRHQRIARPTGSRPRLDVPGPAFSLSHAGGLALIGVTQSPTIGVDLEATRSIRMSRRRREEILAAGAGLVGKSALDDPDSEPAVLQAWCRLEACAKARGSGVAALLGELGLRDRRGRQLPLTAVAEAARRIMRDAHLAVADVRLPPDLCGAVAGEGALPTRVRRFPVEVRAIARLLAPCSPPRGGGRVTGRS
jgi:4'-phosphopantetheinyl transferase